ncbi:hypothetical protein B0W48_00545 [Pseudoalteromonas aliena]|uniref:Uncharacterized protein n=1 Tax=Pseudoalteromonas aliena TaxID=247523 RepID=A0A1Q2GTF6_9GAMM|nr:hypothetical protein [Pseudoalteromonas aliena]AQP98411.1 hypothetical protein B0W48_00545 [Pseudoalteromonas aliena]
MNPISGIIQSGIQYGADKLFGNQASWNFGNVATDAFGNALGNSIVGGIQRSEAENNNRNRYIEVMGQKLTADTARKIDGQLATNLNKSLNTTMQGVDASVDRMLWANNRNLQIDANAQFAADEARRASRQQGVVDRANGLSASMGSARSNLTQRHNRQINSANRVIEQSEQFTRNDHFEVNYGFESELVTGNQNGWVNNALIENTLNQYANDNFNVLPTNSALSTWDYNSRYVMEQLPSLFGTNEINGALLGLGALAKTTSKGWGSTGNNYKSMQSGVVGSYFDRVYGVGKTTVINNYALDTSVFSSGIANVGDGLTKIGYGFTAASSLITLANDHKYGDGIDFGDGFREGGYLAVNSAFAAGSLNRFKNVTALSRLSPIGMAFTALDIALQATPSYTVKYGPHAGQVTDGWTKAMHQTSDIVHANQQINPNYRMFDLGKL